MTKIFDENDKNIIKENLMKLGLEALENGGYKAASIEAIARQAGIAKGTFYNFFQSKESFFFEIMLLMRDKNRQEFFELISDKANLNKESFEDFLFRRYAISKNIYHYFTTDELNIIFRKMPKQLSITNIDSTNFATELFSHVENINTEINNEVVVNIMNIMGSYSADKDRKP
nr:TetR/AcrR family transcriptional regulator [Clostridioides difficile]